MTIFIEEGTRGCPNCGYPLRDVGSSRWETTKRCTNCPCRFHVRGDGPFRGRDVGEFERTIEPTEESSSGSFWPL